MEGQADVKRLAGASHHTLLPSHRSSLADLTDEFVGNPLRWITSCSWLLKPDVIRRPVICSLLKSRRLTLQPTRPNPVFILITNTITRFYLLHVLYLSSYFPYVRATLGFFSHLILAVLIIWSIRANLFICAFKKKVIIIISSSID